MQTQVETQRKAQSLIPLQTVHYSKSMHKMFPRHVCVCEKGETERVSETTRHTERLGDMYGPQKHNGSLTDIFHNRASVSCVQSSLTGVERCNEEETWTFLFFFASASTQNNCVKKKWIRAAQELPADKSKQPVPPKTFWLVGDSLGGVVHQTPRQRRGDKGEMWRWLFGHLIWLKSRVEWGQPQPKHTQSA